MKHRPASERGDQVVTAERRRREREFERELDRIAADALAVARKERAADVLFGRTP